MNGDFAAGLLIGLILAVLAFVGGKEVGWMEHHRGEVICETALGQLQCAHKNNPKLRP